MNKKVRDISCSLLFLITGVFIFIQSLEIKAMMGKDIGSAFMPKVIAIALIGISVLKLILTLLDMSKPQEKKEDIDNMGGLLTIAALLFYVLTFEFLGFIISTAAYLFFQMTILSNDKNRKLILFGIISIIVSVVIYALFVYLIDRPLPIGILGF